MEDRPDDGADRSPWERDDWIPEPFVPDWTAGSADTTGHPAATSGGPVPTPPAPTDAPESVDPDGADREASDIAGVGAPAGARADRPDRRRSGSHAGSSTRIALAVGALAVVAAGAVVLLRDDGADDGPAPGAEPESDTDTATNTEGGALVDEGAATTGPGPMPIMPSATSPVTIGPDTDPPVPRVVDDRPAIAQVVDGEVPAWVQTTVDVPDALRSMDVATELVSVDAAGILRRTELPSGAQRAVGVDLVGQLPFLSVGRTAIVLYSGTRLVLVPDDGPVRFFEIGDGVVSVQARPGTDDFVLTTATPASSLEEIELVLTTDGSVERIDAGRFTDVPLPARNFLSTGTMLVDGPGGVYALDLAGTAQRVSDGDLVATGANHYAVEECDDALVCGFWLVDAVTGERTAVDLAEVAAQSTASRSTRISPDGGSVVYRDDTRGTGIRRVATVATGNGLDVGRADGFQFEDPWAADSSGIFLEREGAVVFHPRDSAAFTIVGPEPAGGPTAPTTVIAVRPAP